MKGEREGEERGDEAPQLTFLATPLSISICKSSQYVTNHPG